MRRVILIVGVMLVSAPVGGVENQARVDYLLRGCEFGNQIRKSELTNPSWEQSFRAARCLGFVEGVLDTHAAIYKGESKKIWCLPQEVTAGQIILIFMKWANKHPERHHEHRLKGLVTAIREAWPCNS